MKVTAIVPYYGSKRQLAPLIVERLGKHTAFVDPFCGSLAVLLAKPACRMEIVNDLNGALVNLARVVACDEQSHLLFEKLSRTLFCSSLYREVSEQLSRWTTEQAALTPVRWAWHYFVVSWMGRNGFVGTTRENDSGFCKRHTSNGGDPATRFRHAVEALPAWWQRLRNVTILSEDAFGLIERTEDREGTVLYADPPYFQKTATYKHDFSPEDHGALAEQLRRFKKTRVLLSYYRVPELDSLYLKHGWVLEELDVQKNLAGGAKAPEVLLSNKP